MSSLEDDPMLGDVIPSADPYLPESGSLSSDLAGGLSESEFEFESLDLGADTMDYVKDIGANMRESIKGMRAVLKELVTGSRVTLTEAGGDIVASDIGLTLVPESLGGAGLVTPELQIVSSEMANLLGNGLSSELGAFEGTEVLLESVSEALVVVTEEAIEQATTTALMEVGEELAWDAVEGMLIVD